ncbi:MAG: hypothetical protein KF729_31630 [Sandaracinaceae bacterium]|nr:hypothetical protein [Sandaracinaceae bacterium]
MRSLATLGWILCAGALAGGCRWPVAPEAYSSAVAHPETAGFPDPPEAVGLTCTREGFTVVVGPEPGCAAIEGIAGGGEVRFESLFTDDPFSRSRVSVPASATPIRVVRAGDRLTDVEVIVRCRPFFNDARQALLLAHRSTCAVADQVIATDCGFGGRFDETLDADGLLELWLGGDGAVVDVRACVRPDP